MRRKYRRPLTAFVCAVASLWLAHTLGMLPPGAPEAEMLLLNMVEGSYRVSGATEKTMQTGVPVYWMTGCFLRSRSDHGATPAFMQCEQKKYWVPRELVYSPTNVPPSHWRRIDVVGGRATAYSALDLFAVPETPVSPQ